MRSNSRIKEFNLGEDGQGPFYYEDEKGRICSKDGIPFRNAEMRGGAHPRRPSPASVTDLAGELRRRVNR